MKRSLQIPLELVTLLYVLVYIPYIIIDRWLALTPLGRNVHPLTGLEMLPVSLILSWLAVLLFIWLGGWQRQAHRWHVAGLDLPRPMRWTALSGVAAGIILVTVPLSFTFPGVSIPFVQLLMRGDILLVAPLVDIISGRRVRWYSWAALVLTAIGLVVAVRARGGLHLPMLCWITIGLYTFGYFLRLATMTRIAKSGINSQLQAYYAEEQLIAVPAALVILALLSLIAPGDTGQMLHRGFVAVWSSPAMLPLLVLGLLLAFTSVLAALILLNKRENTYCVPLERAASILAGVLAAFVLGLFFGQQLPTTAELIGAGLLVVAITVLTLGPRLAGEGR